MDSENIQAQEQEVTQQGKSDMEAFLETFDDDSIKRAFKETLNDAGEFDRNKVKNLAGRMISDRRALSKIKNMPESVEKFKENYKPNDKFAPLFDESNEKGAKIRDMFNKLDELCYSNTIGEDKKCYKKLLVRHFRIKRNHRYQECRRERSRNAKETGRPKRNLTGCTWC